MLYGLPSFFKSRERPASTFRPDILADEGGIWNVRLTEGLSVPSAQRETEHSPQAGDGAQGKGGRPSERRAPATQAITRSTKNPAETGKLPRSRGHRHPRGEVPPRKSLKGASLLGSLPQLSAEERSPPDARLSGRQTCPQARGGLMMTTLEANRGQGRYKSLQEAAHPQRKTNKQRTEETITLTQKGEKVNPSE
ncbi:hypothetical protein NDU88_004364 [Pleurodeles waltl]|uniref:Uncharacterized protein n=1 Tax=Pleurodeles waltl TaxID=8319 RepID=A0AAV7VI17_PLEWA|nr:hypothetical protein NDU88_004364 [Pleurodeles waltl]